MQLYIAPDYKCTLWCVALVLQFTIVDIGHWASSCFSVSLCVIVVSMIVHGALVRDEGSYRPNCQTSLVIVLHEFIPFHKHNSLPIVSSLQVLISFY